MSLSASPDEVRLGDWGGLATLFRPRLGDWIGPAWAVLQKDLRTEFRTRVGLSVLFLFALTTLVAVSYTLGPLGASPEVLAALLWVILFFTAMAGLSRAFVHEEETRTATALRLAAPPEAVYLGKFALNLLLLLGVELVVVPLFGLLMGLPIEKPGLLVGILLLGDWGIAEVSTLLAAMVAQARGKGALFAILALPLLLPLLIVAIGATRMAYYGEPFAEVFPAIKALVSYGGTMLVICLWLFRFAWE